ncbi:MAG: enoyl-CoA hydratase/isomerase family protein [Chloroflexi bacterium]|nr:enoyl-CoA hydratase/isomerase family protein [Chloroflexota bacterium]
MNYNTVVLKKEDHITTLLLNRPDRMNAVSPEMAKELLAALGEIDQDEDTRVVVVTGAGKAFCAGADVGGMAGGNEPGVGSQTAEEQRRWHARVLGKITVGLQKLEKPTIAMVNGVAVGGGFDVALACDMRIGSENARFMNAFVRIGLFPGWGGTWLYPRVMGLAKAFEYLFTGDFLEAKEAERIGVLNRMVPAAELEKETMTLARKIASGPPIAIRLMKLQAYKGLQMDMETAVEMAAACESITLKSEDHREGIAAFREKRPAAYKGK